MLSGTIRDNLRYGRLEASDAAVIAAARAANAHEFIDPARARATTPSSARRAAGLSRGQRQRLSMARAILRTPQS